MVWFWDEGGQEGGGGLEPRADGTGVAESLCEVGSRPAGGGFPRVHVGGPVWCEIGSLVSHRGGVPVLVILVGDLPCIFFGVEKGTLGVIFGSCLFVN